MRTLENPVQNVELLMGPISVLVGDRIEFDREYYFVHALRWAELTNPTKTPPQKLLIVNLINVC